MNWKASLLGAVIVAATGLAVGAGIGGKTTTDTKTTTVTVAQTITTSATTTPAATSPSTTDTTSSTDTTAATTPTPGSQQYYSDYLGKQDQSQLDSLSTNVSLDSSAPTLQLKGQTYPHAVAFDIGNNTTYAPTTESYQVPIAGFKHLSSPIVGLNTNASAQSLYKLKVYKDSASNPNATVLYHATFNGPSQTHTMSFDTQGATDLVFVWTEPSTGEPDGGDNFIIAEPIVTSG